MTVKQCTIFLFLFLDIPLILFACRQKRYRTSAKQSNKVERPDDQCVESPLLRSANVHPINSQEGQAFFYSGKESEIERKLNVMPELNFEKMHKIMQFMKTLKLQKNVLKILIMIHPVRALDLTVKFPLILMIGHRIFLLKLTKSFLGHQKCQARSVLALAPCLLPLQLLPVQAQVMDNRTP